MSNIAAVAPAVGQQLQMFAESIGVARNEPLRVFVANMSHLGTAASGVHMDTCNLLGDLISQSPATSCAIVFHSNVQTPGLLLLSFFGCSIGLPTTARSLVKERALMWVWSGHSACLLALFSGIKCAPGQGGLATELYENVWGAKCLRYGLFCLDCSFTFNDDALPQRKRPAKHEFLLCISKELDARSGSFSSAFAESSLFHRHHISGLVEPLQTSEYVNPLITNLEFGAGHRTGIAPSLSEEALLKQWISGAQLYSKAGPPFGDSS